MNLDLALTISQKIVDKGLLTTEEYFEACGSKGICNQFLLRNVFAINSQGFYGIESKATENAMRARLAERAAERARLAERTGPWASLLRKVGAA